MSVLGQIGAVISLLCIIIGVISLFLPSPYWLLAGLCFGIVVTIWILGFTWRIANAADNIIEKYQDKSTNENFKNNLNEENQSKRGNFEG